MNENKIDVMNIDLVSYRVFSCNNKKLIMENFLNINYLYGETNSFSVDVTDNILTIKKYDNENRCFEDIVREIVFYYDDVGTEMFNYKTLDV